MNLTPQQRAEMAQGIYRTAQAVGAQPADLARVISYETGGTFDPWKAGPVTKWGQHRGLIQWGEPQARQYGVSQNTPIMAQLDAVAKYLRKSGYKPGMGLMDLYSTVNAGHPGAYGASDGYGTVASHVQKMLGSHGNALAKLQGGSTPAATPGPTTSVASMFTAPAAPVASGPSPLLQSTYDPALAGGFDAPEPAAQAASGPNDREQRRMALIQSIGNLFG